MPMKINKAKLLVGVLAVTAVAATVGSISGTFAWFQYNTRVTAAYEGAAAKCSENVQIRLYRPARAADTTNHIDPLPEVKTDWVQDLRTADIAKFLAGDTANQKPGVRTAAANTLAPVTSGKLAADAVADTLYRNPIYQYTDKTDWGKATAEADYIELPFQFRVREVNGDEENPVFLAKKLYLTDLTIAAKTGTLDISNAIRVAIDNKAATAPFTQTFSKTGDPVEVGGKLALGNDKDSEGHSTVDQTEGYEWDTRTDVKYGDYEGDTPSKAYSQKASEKAATGTATKSLVADDTDPTKIIGKELLTTDSFTGTKTAAEEKNNWASLTVRIYLEGWTKLTDIAGTNASPETVWDAVKAIKETTDTDPNNKPVFDVGLRFSAETYR